MIVDWTKLEKQDFDIRACYRPVQITLQSGVCTAVALCTGVETWATTMVGVRVVAVRFSC